MTPSPASSWRRRQVVPALAMLLVAAACGDAAPSPSAAALDPVATASPAPTATPAPLASLPPIGDVPTYKMDARRTNRTPGPDIDDEPVVAWKVNVGCEVAERAVVIGDGAVVLGCNDARLYALDARTGATRWAVDTSGPTYGSAAIDAGRVFLCAADGAIEARSLADGSLAWSRDLEGGYNPIVVDGVLYVGTDTGMLGLSTADGSTSWTYDAGGPGGGTVVDGVAYINAPGGSYVAVDVKTGDELGRRQVRSSATTSPVIADGVVFGGAREEGDDPQGELYAMDPRTLEIRWSTRTEEGNQIGPSALAGDLLLARSVNDGVMAFDARTFERRWAVDAGGGFSPVTTTGSIAYTTEYDEPRNATELIGIRVADGAIAWRAPVDGEVRAAPVASGGMLFVGDALGNVYAFAEPELVALLGAALASPAPTPAPTTTAVPEQFGEPIAVINGDGAMGLSMPMGFDIGPDGNVYLVNARTDEIIVLRPDGTEVRRWGSSGSRKGQFEFQRDEEWGSSIGGVGVAPDGTVYVADTGNARVQAFTSKGKVIRTWGRFGIEPGQFRDPIDLDVDSKGNVYVVDDQRDDIQVFGPDGTYLRTIGQKGTALGRMKYTGNIHLAADDRLVNADFGNNRIQLWDASGTPAWAFGTSGSKPGQFRDPGDVTMAPDGTVYVTDRTRVQAIRDGAVVATWTTPPPRVPGAVAIVGDELWIASGWDTIIWRFALEP